MDAPPNSVAQIIEFASKNETAILFFLLIKAKSGLDQRFPKHFIRARLVTRC